jgi:hypothetical protein
MATGNTVEEGHFMTRKSKSVAGGVLSFIQPATFANVQ